MNLFIVIVVLLLVMFLSVVGLIMFDVYKALHHVKIVDRARAKKNSDDLPL